MSKWSRSDVIGLFGLVIAAGSFCVALVVVPEFRQLFGLDRSTTTPSTTVQPSPSIAITSPSIANPAIAPSALVTPSQVNRLPTAPIQPTPMSTAQPTAALPQRSANAPASWCQSVKDGRQFCEAHNICIESKETHLLKLKENGCQ